MAELVNDRTVFSLAEVTRSIQKTLAERYTSTFWVKAEMNKLNLYPQSGHCYPDLVEKTDGKIVAEIRSTIWKDDYHRINENFLNILHEPLKSGINILFCAKVSFSPLHGLSLSILDIDPSYSLGELEKEKQQTLDRIRKEGIYNSNKSLALPLLPKRIAVISVQTSKGFSDFRKVIDENGWGYRFVYLLFPSLLQGEHAVESILAQLGRIRKVLHHFDAVAIIRGGGGDVGLTCYNNYELAREIALYPIPVITGIGHSTNETVAEMVAFRNAITPTELADFLIQKFHNFSVPLQKAEESISQRLMARLKDEKSRVLNMVRYFKSVTVSGLGTNRNNLMHELRALGMQTGYFMNRNKLAHDAVISALQKNTRQQIGDRNRHIEGMGAFFRKDVTAIINHRKWMIQGDISLLQKAAERLLQTHRQETATGKANLISQAGRFISGSGVSLTALNRQIELLDPANVLKRGYSITMVNGKVIKSVSDVEEGAILKTMVPDGMLTSITSSIIKTDQP
ncbi:MAG: exodeoxyribonuclease VII large subunit [Bacteroidota bacterium]